jgi:hypothetical protein
MTVQILINRKDLTKNSFAFAYNDKIFAYRFGEQFQIIYPNKLL